MLEITQKIKIFIYKQEKQKWRSEERRVGKEC